MKKRIFEIRKIVKEVLDKKMIDLKQIQKDVYQNKLDKGLDIK